jgi:cytochrome P450
VTVAIVLTQPCSSTLFRHVTAIFGNGLLTSEGDFWLRQRRLAQPAFHRDRVAGYGSEMVHLAERHCDSWRDGERRDVHRDMMAVTLHIVTRTLFGTDVDEGTTAEVGRAFDGIVEEIARRFRRPFRIPDAVPTPGNLRYRSGVRRLDRLVYALIEERRRTREERGDLLSLLLRARDEDGGRMTDRQLRDEVVTFSLPVTRPRPSRSPRPGTSEFRPERWLDGLQVRLPRGAYVPFGAGPRLCIGQSFALMEASLILATVARRLRFDLDPGRTVTPFPSITLRPSGGVPARVSAWR